MELNDVGFPNYLELVKKFDLHNNPELDYYINYMYKQYNDVFSVMNGLSSEKIQFLKKLDKLLEYKYFNEIYSNPRERDNIVLDLFVNEPDKQAAVQRLYEIYMDQCREDFRREIGLLFKK